MQQANAETGGGAILQVNSGGFRLQKAESWVINHLFAERRRALSTVFCTAANDKADAEQDAYDDDDDQMVSLTR